MVIIVRIITNYIFKQATKVRDFNKKQGLTKTLPEGILRTIFPKGGTVMIRAMLNVYGLNYRDVNYNASDFSYSYQAKQKDH